ncbi:MAG: hypothetical protein OXT65_03940 [Alphaproteobacteria bacterium]|nr:hypothetical protein [Alphaproteobacteria bacterium]
MTDTKKIRQLLGRVLNGTFKKSATNTAQKLPSISRRKFLLPGSGIKDTGETVISDTPPQIGRRNFIKLASLQPTSKQK